MAQRTLDSLFWDDEDMAKLEFAERLLFLCMVTDVSLSDDYGVLPASPRVLKKHAFGLDDNVTNDMVRDWRDGIIEKCRNIVFYSVDGQEYIWLRSFDKWQKLRHRRKTTLPLPNHKDAIIHKSTVDGISEDCGNITQECGKFPLSSVELSSVEKNSICGNYLSEFTEQAYRAFESDIGMLSPAQLDDVKDMLEQLYERDIQQWWYDAVKIAADMNKRSWAYIRTILQNCLREGKPPRPRETIPKKPTKQELRVIDPDTGDIETVEAMV